MVNKTTFHASNDTLIGWVSAIEALPLWMHGSALAAGSSAVDQMQAVNASGFEVFFAALGGGGHLGRRDGLRCAGLDHRLQSDGIAGEVPDGQLVLIGYAVINHLANPARGNIKVGGERCGPSAFFVKPIFQFHAQKFSESETVSQAITKLYFDKLRAI